MNQAALHKLLAQTTKPKDLDAHFELRLATNLTLLKDLFLAIYPKGIESGAFNDLLTLLPKLYKTRSHALREQDLSKINSGNWYQSEKIMGMQLYVDHFNKDLKGLQQKLSYFEDLGINLLHLMPITTRPKGENDGGYAVNDYTAIDKRYGTKKDLDGLTTTLRAKKMYLMLDFVVNHTSNEHSWAKKAKAGQKKYQDYYYTYPDRTIPNEFEKSLPEIFPETSPGNYTYVPEMDKWVMTVFNSYQWDLNYTNPQVFMEMLANLVKLVNLGVDIVRFDALAFLWKKMGTDSQNLPEAHTIIALFKMCLQVVAPGTILLAEAIVAPLNIIRYFGEGNKEGNECEVAYNASLMALLWNSMATKKTALLYKTIANIPTKPQDATWINYIRCHDDIGLGLDDRFINEMGWNPQGHRKFLLDYYCQNLAWSPAKGLMFMYNPKNGDGRITGSAASLLGLEKALETNDVALQEQAVDKIIMLHGIILSFGGIPFIYAGDEIGTLNDYSFLKDANKKEDSRWANRPQQDWATIASVKKKKGPQATIFGSLKNMIARRKKTPEFADGNNMVLHHTSNEHILIFERTGATNEGVLVISNFDEHTQVLDGNRIAKLGYLKDQKYHDIIANQSTQLNSGFLALSPYQLLWLKKY
ncbi:MAG: alpha amylase [Croceitalea sp.]|nr:alpha amylase [Croceitalea sp.]